MTNNQKNPNKKTRKILCPVCKRDVSTATAEIEFLKNIGICSRCDHVSAERE